MRVPAEAEPLVFSFLAMTWVLVLGHLVLFLLFIIIVGHYELIFKSHVTLSSTPLRLALRIRPDQEPGRLYSYSQRLSF